LPTAAPPTEPAFVLFAPSHLATLAVVALAVLALPLAGRRLPAAAQRRVAVTMALVMVVGRLADTLMRRLAWGVPIREQLPLHLCGILAFVCAWMLWRESYPTFEIAYFWGLAGTTQALVTPDLPVGFPHAGYLAFFANHALLLVSVAWGMAVLGFRPRPRSIVKAWLAVNVYAALVAPVNLLLDTNYLYLRRKPAGASLLDHFGPWPWYLLALEAVALVLFAFCYLPWALADRGRRRTSANGTPGGGDGRRGGAAAAG